MTVDSAPSRDGKAGRTAWLVTFSDIVLLMLTFFVMLFAMQKIDQGTWETLSESLSRSLAPGQDQAELRPNARRNIATFTRKRGDDPAYIEAILKEKAARDPVLSRAIVRRYGDRVVLSLPGDLLFPPGSAELTAHANETLFDLGGVLRYFGNRIDVQGHSDPTPPKGAGVPSNRELSLARAAAVAERLKRSGYPRPVGALGYGAARFGDLAAVESRERRFALGRRVDLVIHLTRDLD